jgi:hypothetical protein
MAFPAIPFLPQTSFLGKSNLESLSSARLPESRTTHLQLPVLVLSLCPETVPFVVSLVTGPLCPESGSAFILIPSQPPGQWQTRGL